MYMMYYMNENNERVYTMAKVDPRGNPTFSAHPARWSDTFSCHLITKFLGSTYSFFILDFALEKIIRKKFFDFKILTRVFWKFSQTLFKSCLNNFHEWPKLG